MQTFDATKHSIGLGTSTGTLKGLMVPYGGYRKGVQDFENRRIQVGENRWLQDYKVSEWAQADFSGGAYQDILSDPAMFSRCMAMLPSKKDPKAARTTQTLAKLTSNGSTHISAGAFAGLGAPKDAVVAWGCLYVLGSNDIVYCIVPSATEGTAAVYSYSAVVSGATAQCITANRNIGTYLVGYSTGEVREFYRYGGGGTPGALFRKFAIPAGIPTRFRTVKAMTQFAGKMVIAYRNRLYYWDASNSLTAVDGSGFVMQDATGCAPVFLGDAAEEEVVCFTEYKAGLYILSRTGNTRTAVDTTTMVAGVLPWLSIPYIFRGQALMSYAGRMYLGGAGCDTDGSYVHAQLFEINNTELKEVRVFYDLYAEYAGATAITQIPNFAVHEGILFFANDVRDALEGYDFITDSLWTAYPLAAADGVGTKPYLVFSMGTTMFVLATGTSAGLYYIPRANYHAVAPTLETSEFAVEPARLKKWLTVTIHSRYCATTVRVSQNGGQTWTTLPAVGSPSWVGYNCSCVFDASGISPSATIKVEVNCGTSNQFSSSAYYWREVVEVIVAFLVEPAVLRLYDLTVQLVENSELLDATAGVPSVDTTSDPDTDIATLWGWYDAQTPLVLRDRDGTDRLVMITKIQEVEHALGGKRPTASSVDREVFLYLTLAETTSA